jgi:hypothetical protein
MRPSDFILNSDYLSIAQTGRNTFTLTIGGGTLPVNGYSEQNLDFPINAVTGAIDRIMISKDSGNYRLGSVMTAYPNNDVRCDVAVYRNASNTLRAQVILQNYSGGTATYPSMTFGIKVSTFMPPNVF